MLEKKIDELKETFSLKNNLPEGTAQEKAEKLKEENKDVEFVQKYKELKKKYKRNKKI